MNANEMLNDLNQKKREMESDIEKYVAERITKYEEYTGLTIAHLRLFYQPAETMGNVVKANSTTTNRF